MSADIIESAKPEIARDRFKRPMVIPPKGGKPVAYTRCTTYVSGIEDTFKLGQWQQRHLAVGLAMRPDLLSAVGVADLDDRDTLNNLCDAAKNAAGAGDSASLGTWLHAVTERVDRGDDVDTALRTTPMPELAMPRDPMDFERDIVAYQEATADLKPVHIEQFTVLDNLKIGGTPDRVVSFGGKRYIADLKTGSVEWGALKIAAQLAVYARSAVYDIATGERTTHGASTERGIVIHLPAGTGTCRLYWVDLLAGWEAVRVCRSIREQRTANKFRALMQPVETRPTFSYTRENESDRGAREVESRGLTEPRDLATRVTSCTTADQVRDLWRANASSWNDDLTALAKTHIASLV